MKNIILFFFLFTLCLNVEAQDIDKGRMDRDLEVAENVLSTLLGKKHNRFYYLSGFSNEAVESSYLRDYGVVIAVKRSLFPISINQDFSTISIGKGDEKDSAQKVVIAPGKLEAGSVVLSSSDYEKNKDKTEDDFIAQSKTFLVDYGHLIGQLNPQHHIMIKWGGNSSPLYLFNEYSDASGGNYSFSTPGAQRQITIEIKVSDIRDHQQGRIDRDEALSRVVVTRSEHNAEKVADLELLASMFERLYKSDLSDTYYSTNRVAYTSLKNYGVIFKMKVYSSVEEGGLFRIPTIGTKTSTIEERNQKVMEMLPAFEKSFKENLINYGRTVKSIAPNETLRFEISMTQCDGCQGFPKSIHYSVKGSVLDQFNKGAISLENAMTSITVDKK